LARANAYAADVDTAVAALSLAQDRIARAKAALA
jgi:hypothetical protein